MPDAGTVTRRTSADGRDTSSIHEVKGGSTMASTTESGGVTGTKDKDYNLIWYVESCLSNALRLETYIQDAERDSDTEVVELFRKAQADSRKGAELGKQLLRTRMGS
jgi:hypothetical protein